MELLYMLRYQLKMFRGKMMYKIVILEDDPMVQSINKQYVDKFMKGYEYQVICVEDSRNALKLIQKEQINLILLDIYMPQLSGLDVLNILIEKNMHPQVIMLTAASDTEKIGRALDYGVLDYLIKPFTYQRFEMAMDKFIKIENVLSLRKDYSQEQVDNLFYQNKFKKSNVELPKGLSEYSLTRIQDYITQIDDYFSTQDIVHLSKLSRISVKKYLDYLVSQGKLTEELKYSKVGRPTIIYKKN